MKIVVFTYDRVETATTPNILEKAGLEYLVVCHSEDRRKEFIQNGTAKEKHIVASGVPMGLANNRNWYLDTQLKDGEWCLMLVDDWIKACELEEYESHAGTNRLPITTRNTTAWGRKFKHQVDIAVFYRRALELQTEAHARGVRLAGFAGNDNALFRATRWKRNVLADGRAWVMQKSELRLDPNVQMVDDVCFCVQNILYGGGVLVNQWVLPYCQRYSAGAFGHIPERLERKKQECRYLVEAYPGLVRYANKAGWPPGTHVQIVPSKPERVSRLRESAAAGMG